MFLYVTLGIGTTVFQVSWKRKEKKKERAFALYFVRPPFSGFHI